jgi:hypothetical protein
MLMFATLFAAQSSVDAKHFIAGGGRYSLTLNTSEISVTFQFLGVLKGLPDAIAPAIETDIQTTIRCPGCSPPLRILTSGTEVDIFDVVANSQHQHSITMTGNMLSRLVRGEEPNHRHLTEIVHFQVNALDAALPGAGKDAMTLRLDYRETDSIAPIIKKNFSDLVTCDKGVCSLRLEGVLTEGEIESHTLGGD